MEKSLLKKRLWHRCFPVNFVKFLRTPFYIEHLWWLLLKIVVQVFVKLHHLEQREKKKECSTILKLISLLCNSTWEKAISCCVESIMLESFVGCRSFLFHFLLRQVRWSVTPIDLKLINFYCAFWSMI